MSKETKVNSIEIVDMLDKISARGFMSEPVKHRSFNFEEQHCNFTQEEKTKIRQFIADNIDVLRNIDYPLPDFGYGESKNQRTCSLLSMISYMISSSGDNPEYVAQTSGKIKNIIEQLEPSIE